MTLTEHAAAMQIICSLVMGGHTATEVADMLTSISTGRDYAYRTDLRELLDWLPDQCVWRRDHLPIG